MNINAFDASAEVAECLRRGGTLPRFERLLVVALVDVDNRKRLLLNFADVTFMSSAALNKLIVLEKRVKKQGGRLKLCNLRRELREIFDITRLSTIFEILDTDSEAIATF